MPGLIDLTRRILLKHRDPRTGVSELTLLGYCSVEMASERISRYILASRFARGVVLDIASGSCYGSSILRRGEGVELVVSVDIDIDVLRYGRIVYSAECVQADAANPPFRENSFDTIVSIETLEHIRDQGAFLSNLRKCLKKKGQLVLTTPNKLYSSPLIPRPLNPYHVREYYLGQLLSLIELHGFKVSRVYGGKRVSIPTLARRIMGSLIKFILGRLSAKPYLVDKIYGSIGVALHKSDEGSAPVDPDPDLIQHVELRTNSNIALYEYFLIHALPQRA